MKYTRLFVTLSILLAALLLALWLLPGPPHQWRTWRAPPPQPPELQDALSTLMAPNPAAAASYPEAAERPLFAANRRPTPTDAAVAPPPPTPIDQARLLGIFVGSGINSIMIDYDGKTRIVRKGEDVGGWRLTDMRERTATFEHEGQQRNLTLPVVSPQAPPPKTPAPASGTLADRLAGGGAVPQPAAPIPVPTFNSSRRAAPPPGAPQPATPPR